MAFRNGNKIRYRHGFSNTSVHWRWCAMIDRCTNKNNPQYKDYGKRGISVCERWVLFENFLADMGEPLKGMSLDRINNDGNYEPSNCKWSTRKEQQRNTRKSYIAQAEMLGLTRHAICYRLKKGWPREEALTRPRGYRYIKP